MSFYGNTNWDDQVALGLVPGWKPVNGFGRTTNADLDIATDIWSGANVIPQPIWLQPTVAQTMNIASTDAADDGSPVGTGIRTLRVFGLKTWSSAEVTEDIVMNGVTAVPTVNTYVMVNRIEGLTFGSAGQAVGNISCTGATDSRIVVVIEAGKALSHLGVYGFPSGTTLLLKGLTITDLGLTTIRADIAIMEKRNADQADANFAELSRHAVRGGVAFTYTPSPPVTIPGPAIIKFQAIANSNNQVIACNFDGSLVDD